mgnify:CR=1 FL=1|jgi:hypothetical protein|tara:strand:+ start:8201 stop:8374 length:174 start_codon:yes stop_codon:yes gene_type:complete
MKLWYRSKKDGQLKDLDLSFWSFVKCHFLGSLGLTLIIWGTFFVIGLALGLLGMAVI